jgi:hypothetical protein
MKTKVPNRTTEELRFTLDKGLAATVRDNARRMGLTISDYMAALAKGQSPLARPSSDMAEISLATNRVVRAIGLLDGEEVDRIEMLRLLRDAQRFLVTESLKALPAYESAVEAQGKDEAWGELDSLTEST